MKNIILYLLMGIILFSCSKENSQISSKKNDRLSFKDINEFIVTYRMLAKMESKEDLLFWAQTKNHSTLLNSNEASIENYSDAIKTILNKDSEFELGDSIIWFNNGKLYAFQKKDEAIMNTLKQRPSKIHQFGYITVGTIINSKLKSTILSLDGDGRLDARYQKQFTQQYYQPCGGTRSSAVGTRKHVFEIYDETTFFPGVYVSNLYIHIKLEWRGSDGWKKAGEQRFITINISGTADIYFAHFNYSVNKSYDCSGNVQELLASVVGTANSNWNVTLWGTIYQTVKGDISANSYTVSGTQYQPLW